MSKVRAIAHRLIRQTGEQSYHLKEQLFESETLSRKMLSEIQEAFSRRATKRYGRFADEGTSFKGLTLNWQENGLNLVQFSSKVTELLAALYEEQDLETDGYWVFIELQEEEQHELWIANIKQQQSLYLDELTELSDSHHINFAKMGLCCCLDLKRLFEPSAHRYITLGFGFGDRSATQALMAFLGFFDTVDTQADTERFMDIVRNYSSTMPEEVGKRYQKEVAEFCIEQAKAGEVVSYTDVTQSIESQSDTRLDQFVSEQAPDLQNQFIPDQSSLKKYIRYTGRTREVSISFSNESLGRSIAYDPDTETLTLKDLPASLVKQLKEL